MKFESSQRSQIRKTRSGKPERVFCFSAIPVFSSCLTVHLSSSAAAITETTVKSESTQAVWRNPVMV